jgi:TolB-like protein
MRSFLGELKRRNVHRAAAFYAAAGWLLVQIATQVFPFYDIPNWAVRLVIAVVLIGFPFALLFSWFYEWTPEGLKRESEVDPSDSIMRATGKKLDLWIIATLSLAVVLLLADRFVLHNEASDGAASSTSNKSIAVLPFENLSDDRANAYFAEGIQEEILTQLAKIGALKVISHTSTQQYTSKPVNLAEIAKQLGVTNILKGSVQRAANAVHINVQLVRAATAENLWAESYNRTLDDIFGVEGEVAHTVADTLKARLTGAEAQLLARPTNNAAAYDAYLRGVTFKFRADSAATSIENGVAAFEEAVRLDPDFGLAWANLSQQQSFAYWYVDPSADHAAAARKALQNARRLAPAAPETLMAQGLEHYWLQRDYEGAKAIFERVRVQFPNFAEAVWTLGAIARRQGHWQESRKLYDETLALDPQNVPRLFDASATLMAQRDLPALRLLLDRGLTIAPGDSGLLATQIAGLQMSGDIARAQALIDRVLVARRDTFMIEAVTRNAVLAHKYEAAIAILKSQIESKEGLGTDLGEYAGLLGDLQRHAGDVGGARASYARARDALETQLHSEPDCHLCLNRLAVAQAGLGNREAALDAARRAVALLPSAKDAYVGPTYEEDLARLQARFDDKDAAISTLQRLIAIPYGYPPVTSALLRLDPDFDALRGDPRFQKLVANGEAAGLE